MHVFVDHWPEDGGLSQFRHFPPTYSLAGTKGHRGSARKSVTFGVIWSSMYPMTGTHLSESNYNTYKHTCLGLDRNGIGRPEAVSIMKKKSPIVYCKVKPVQISKLESRFSCTRDRLNRVIFCFLKANWLTAIAFIVQHYICPTFPNMRTQGGESHRNGQFL